MQYEAQGSKRDEAVFSYGDSSASTDNEVMRDLYLGIVERRNFVRQSAPSKQGDGVVTYVEPKCVEEQRSIMEFIPR